MRARIFTLTLLSFFTLATYLFVFCYRYFVSTIHMKLLDSANADVTYTSEKIDQTLESGLDMADVSFHVESKSSKRSEKNRKSPKNSVDKPFYRASRCKSGENFGFFVKRKIAEFRPNM